jgi:hypothetical protein
VKEHKFGVTRIFWARGLEISIQDTGRGVKEGNRNIQYVIKHKDKWKETARKHVSEADIETIGK